MLCTAVSNEVGRGQWPLLAKVAMWACQNKAEEPEGPFACLQPAYSNVGDTNTVGTLLFN